MGSLRRVMDTHTDRGRQRTFSHSPAAALWRADKVPGGQPAAPPKRHRRPKGSPARRSILVPGHSHQRTKLLQSHHHQGCAASPAASDQPARRPLPRPVVRNRPAVTVAVVLHRPSSPRPPAHSSADRSGSTSTAAYRTPRTRPPDRTPSTAPCRAASDALCAEMDTAEPSPSSAAWIRPVSYHGCSGAPGRTCRPPGQQVLRAGQ